MGCVFITAGRKMVKKQGCTMVRKVLLHPNRSTESRVFGMNCRRHGSRFFCLFSRSFRCISIPGQCVTPVRFATGPSRPWETKRSWPPNDPPNKESENGKRYASAQHTTCRPEHCSSMHAPLSLRADAASLRLLYSRSCALAPQDRQAREKVDDWMARASSTPGNNYDKQQHAHNQAPAPVPLCFLSL